MDGLDGQVLSGIGEFHLLAIPRFQMSLIVVVRQGGVPFVGGSDPACRCRALYCRHYSQFAVLVQHPLISAVLNIFFVP